MVRDRTAHAALRTPYAARMNVDERFQEAIEALERHFIDLVEAGEAAARDSHIWGGWSFRFQDRLLGDRRRLAILLEPPAEGDPRLAALYDAGVAIRDLWEAMNNAIAGKPAPVESARTNVETALARARTTIPNPDSRR
jgi:hypothetical protein